MIFFIKVITVVVNDDFSRFQTTYSIVLINCTLVMLSFSNCYSKITPLKIKSVWHDCNSKILQSVHPQSKNPPSFSANIDCIIPTGRNPRKTGGSDKMSNYL